MTRSRAGPRRRRRSLLAAATLIAAAGPACVVGARPPAALPLPPAPPEVEVGMTEYAFEFDPAVPSGRVVFEVVNRGTADHALTLIALDEDFPPIQEQLRGEVRRSAPTLARVPALPPGERSTFALDLAPGRYAIICFVTDRDGLTHAVKGQAAEFRVG